MQYPYKVCVNVLMVWYHLETILQRTFLGLKVAAGWNDLLIYVAAVNKALQEFNLPMYYEVMDSVPNIIITM